MGNKSGLVVRSAMMFAACVLFHGTALAQSTPWNGVPSEEWYTIPGTSIRIFEHVDTVVLWRLDNGVPKVKVDSDGGHADIENTEGEDLTILADGDDQHIHLTGDDTTIELPSGSDGTDVDINGDDNELNVHSNNNDADISDGSSNDGYEDAGKSGNTHDDTGDGTNNDWHSGGGIGDW